MQKASLEYFAQGGTTVGSEKGWNENASSYFEKLRDFVYFTRILLNIMFCESFRENNSNLDKNS